jgi:hypothetical protein
MAKTKTEFLQEIVKAYRAADQTWPSTARTIAGWAIHEGLWQPPSKNLIDQCAGEIAAAMRDEYFTDPQGRTVRKKHPYREIEELPDGKHKQLFLWVDVADAEPDEMEKAFQFGRKLVVNDCKQLKTDVDSYNDNNPHGKYIEICFDFRDDLEEAGQPTVYPGL